MFGLSLTKIGASVAGFGALLLTFPQDVAIGSYHGTVITVGHVAAIVGGVCTVFGWRNAIQKSIDAINKTK